MAYPVAVALFALRDILIGVITLLVAQVKFTSWLDLLAATALLFICTAHAAVPIRMFPLIYQFQVFYAIVKLVAVFVVNMLFAREKPAQMLFHDVAMLLHRPLENRDTPVAIPCYPSAMEIDSLSSSPFNAALHRTAHEPRLSCIEFFAATKACLEHGISIQQEVA